MDRAPKHGIDILAVVVQRVGGIAGGFWVGVFIQQTMGTIAALGMALGLAALGLALVHALMSNRLLRAGSTPVLRRSATKEVM
jgi:hypothetical protein